MNELEQALQYFWTKVMQCGEFRIKEFTEFLEPVFQNCGYRQNDNGNIKNILIVRLDEIGDNILNSALLREVRMNYPCANITLVVNPVVYNLVEISPYVNTVCVFNGSTQRNFGEAFFTIVDLCKQFLWKKHFDLCILPRWDFDRYFSNLLGYISGANQRIGYSEHLYDGKEKMNAGFDLFLSKAILSPKNILHEVERNLFLLKEIGLTIKKTSLEIWYDSADYIKAKQLLQQAFASKKNLVVVAIGANETNKKYPKELYAKVFLKLVEKHTFIILLGGKMDFEDNAYIGNILGEQCCLNLAGQTTLREAAAIISFANMYIGNDTGLMHMAAAMSKPILEINREASTCPRTILSLYERFFPWQTLAYVVRPKQSIGQCAEHLSSGGCISPEAHCIKQISPETIIEAYDSLKKIRYRM